MARSIPFSALKDFLVNGKGREQGKFDPPDSDLNDVVAVLETGLDGRHLADGSIGSVQLSSIRLLPFAGVDGTGLTPDLTCALTGALAGDTVTAILDTSDFSDARSLFASTVAVDDEIEQSSLTDLSANTYIALLIAA